MNLSQRIRQHQSDLKLKQAAEDVIAFPFYGLGWLLGKVWWLVYFCFSSVILGFKDGNQ